MRKLNKHLCGCVPVAQNQNRKPEKIGRIYDVEDDLGEREDNPTFYRIGSERQFRIFTTFFDTRYPFCFSRKAQNSIHQISGMKIDTEIWNSRWNETNANDWRQQKYIDKVLAKWPKRVFSCFIRFEAFIIEHRLKSCFSFLCYMKNQMFKMIVINLLLKDL